MEYFRNWFYSDVRNQFRNVCRNQKQCSGGKNLSYVNENLSQKLAGEYGLDIKNVVASVMNDQDRCENVSE